MNTMENISKLSIIASSSLVIMTILFSYWQKLNLEKDIIFSILRAIVQLVAIGYVLEYVFGYKNPIFTTLFVIFMIFNAAQNVSERVKNIKNGMAISFLSISFGTAITLAVLLLSKTIRYEAYQIIPICGMIISNAMIALSLAYKKMTNDFKNKKEEIETKLSLGADTLESSINIIRDCIKTGMLPTIDKAKTLGIVSLPGMMTGLILAGSSPIEAIKYQIIVTFMFLSATSTSSFIACYLSYKSFFNKRKQLVDLNQKN